MPITILETQGDVFKLPVLSDPNLYWAIMINNNNI